MNTLTLSADDLLAGSALTQAVALPETLRTGKALAGGQVLLRPLTVRDLQRIYKASRDDDGLAATLMIQQALVEPALRVDQVAQLPAGLARFLVEQINALSGISATRDGLEELVQAPLARACFTLAREFGWTPEQVSGMTIGQILLFLQMSQTSQAPADERNGHAH